MKVELAAGTVLEGKYRIRRLLGRGGMGTVFEAENVQTHKRVALKCIDPERAADPELVERLLREAQATSRIRHPNIVDVYDVGRDGAFVFLVMEYLEGELLSQLMARRPSPLHRVIALLLAAMRGVAEAHRQGVVHRDIKPDNIFLTKQLDRKEPVPKVLDFGVSKLEARGQELRALTAAGRAVGTPRYMSYEQLSGEGIVDGRADVYAFGVILYELLTGRVPHDVGSFSELLVRLSTDPPAAPSKLRAGIPESLSSVVMHALARDREQRIASLHELIGELEPFATERGFLANTISVGRYDRDGTLLGGFAAPLSHSASQPPCEDAFVARDAPTTGTADATSSNSTRRSHPWVLGALIAGTGALLLLAFAHNTHDAATTARHLAPRVEPKLAPRIATETVHARQPTPAHQTPPPLPAARDDSIPAPPSARFMRPSHVVPLAPSDALVRRRAPAASAPTKPRDFGIY